MSLPLWRAQHAPDLMWKERKGNTHTQDPHWSWGGRRQHCSWHGFLSSSVCFQKDRNKGAQRRPLSHLYHIPVSRTIFPVGESSLCFLDKLTVGRREVRVQHSPTDTVYVLLWQSVRRAERLAGSSLPKGKRTIKIRGADVPQDQRMGRGWQRRPRI